MFITVLFPVSRGVANSLQYETCTPENSYYENDFKKRNDFDKFREKFQKENCPDCFKSFLYESGKTNADWFKPSWRKGEKFNHTESVKLDEYYRSRNLACMATTMGTPRNFSFSKCENSQYKTKQRKPCASQSYVELVHDSFVKGAECIGLSKREMFPLFARESSFHINAISPSGCRGIGQVCSIAVREMDQLDLKDRTDKAEPLARGRLLGKKSCEHFHESLSRPNREPGASIPKCELVSAPENPNHNMMYAMRMYAYDRRIAGNLLNDQKQFLQKFNFTKHENEDLQVFLTRMMYNGGWPSIRSRFKAFLRSAGKSSLKDLKINFSKYIKNYYPSNDLSQRVQTANYPVDIEKANDEIENKGRACFR